MSSDINRRFAKHLRKLRERRGLTQEELAERAGIAYKHLQELEGSDPPSPRLETLDRLARALRVTRAALVNF